MDMKIHNKNGMGGSSAGTLDSLSKTNQSQNSESIGAVGRGGSQETAKRTGPNNEKGVGVNVSDRARDISAAKQKAFEIAKNTDPVRAERVAELKAKILSGSYQVDAEKIAHGMLREAAKDELSKIIS